MKRNFRNTGYTLIELLVGMVLCALLLGVVSGFAVTGVRLWRLGADKIDIDQSALMALHAFQTNLQSSDVASVYINPGGVAAGVSYLSGYDNNGQLQYVAASPTPAPPSNSQTGCGGVPSCNRSATPPPSAQPTKTQPPPGPAIGQPTATKPPAQSVGQPTPARGAGSGTNGPMGPGGTCNGCNGRVCPAVPSAGQPTPGVTATTSGCVGGCITNGPLGTPTQANYTEDGHVLWQSRQVLYFDPQTRTLRLATIPLSPATIQPQPYRLAQFTPDPSDRIVAGNIDSVLVSAGPLDLVPGVLNPTPTQNPIYVQVSSSKPDVGYSATLTTAISTNNQFGGDVNGCIPSCP